MLKILEKVKSGDDYFVKAFELYIYRIRKYIGAYFAALGKCDAIVFTGGVGAGDVYTRKKIYKNTENILKDSKIFVIPTNEELMIAKEIRKVLSKN